MPFVNLTMKLRELEYIPQVLTQEHLLNQAGLGDKPMSIEELSLPKVGKKNFYNVNHILNFTL